MPKSWGVVDLGTKTGSAIAEFLHTGHKHFATPVRYRPEECLGIDRNGGYARALKKHGFSFMEADVLDALEQLPAADFYLAWDFLEHLPSRSHSDSVLRAMLSRSRKGLWLRMPSFEQDTELGEGALRRLGLRFTWTHWHGHPSHYLLCDAMAVLRDANAPYKLFGSRKIRSTADCCVVPIDAPVDSVDYKPDYGAKAEAVFEPPLIGQWNILVLW